MVACGVVGLCLVVLLCCGLDLHGCCFSLDYDFNGCFCWWFCYFRDLLLWLLMIDWLPYGLFTFHLVCTLWVVCWCLCVCFLVRFLDVVG